VGGLRLHPNDDIQHASASFLGCRREFADARPIRADEVDGALARNCRRGFKGAPDVVFRVAGALAVAEIDERHVGAIGAHYELEIGAGVAAKQLMSVENPKVAGAADRRLLAPRRVDIMMRADLFARPARRRLRLEPDLLDLDRLEAENRDVEAFRAQ
jgi:hypothetical protein